MGDDRPFVCNAPGCGQRFTNEDHLAVHKHKHEMTLKFGPARDGVIVADQTPTPTRFLKNCEEVGLFNELANPFEQEFKKADEDDSKKVRNRGARGHSTRQASLLPPKDLPFGSCLWSLPSPPALPDSASDSATGIPPKHTGNTTPTIVRPGTLLLAYDNSPSLQPTLPSPTSVITPTPPSNRTLVIYASSFLPRPPVNSSGPPSPSPQLVQSEAKLPTPSLAGRRRRLTEEDPDERRRRFLERNRAAASRCRQKRKVWVLSLEKKAEELTHMNVQLQNEVTILRNEVAQLKQLLLAHKDCPVTTLQKKTHEYISKCTALSSSGSTYPLPPLGKPLEAMEKQQGTGIRIDNNNLYLYSTPHVG
uniref:Cyclic AMP-dependent transcription factor ATF-7 n=1 Tax=Callorhinchus milii TaxID=7868 RepID=A0A4W3I3H3_CALMI